MALGDPQDFRMKLFAQTELFPAQDHVGGAGSAMLRSLTTPSGSTNMSKPTPPMTFPAMNFPGITFPGFNLPQQIPPIVIQAGAGGTAGTTITVQPLGGTAYTDINTIQFTGNGLVGVTNPSTGVALVEYQDTGGGGGGTTLVYGQVTSSSRITGNTAAWSYTIQPWKNGAAFGSTVTAKNLLEKANTSTNAYGYSVSESGGDRVGSTSYYVYPVPTNTWVAMEYTNAFVTSGYQYWFSAPNPIAGSC